MIEKLQQLVAESAALLQAYTALEEQRISLVEIGHGSVDVAVVLDAAAKLRTLAPQFGAFMDQAQALEVNAEQAYDAAQAFIDSLREQSVDVVSDVNSESDLSADACNEDAEDFERWVGEQEESAPEQLSRRRAPMPFFRVG
jgi:hypothetical protein